MSTKKRVRLKKIYNIISVTYVFKENYSMSFARKIARNLSKVDENYPTVHRNSLDNRTIYIDK